MSIDQEVRLRRKDGAPLLPAMAMPAGPAKNRAKTEAYPTAAVPQPTVGARAAESAGRGAAACARGRQSAGRAWIAVFAASVNAERKRILR